MIHLANKIHLLWLICLPLLFFWHRFIHKKGHRHILFSSKPLLQDSEKSFKALAHRSQFWVKAAAITLLILAMARPQLVNRYEIDITRGIDILITLDISGSMNSIDFKPRNRLEVAKGVITDFIGKRTSDRIGLVVFAGTSYTRCPLTSDYGILRHYLGETAIGELEDGTAIGMALATAVNRIRSSPSKTKVIILLTDGVNNRGEIDPRDAAKIAHDYGVKVYTIGVGTRGKAPYPVTDSFGNTRLISIDVEIDEELLKEVANQTGGLYFRATDRDSLEQIFTEIDRWEKSEIATRRFEEKKDLYAYFLGAAFLLLLLLEIAKRTVLRTLP